MTDRRPQTDRGQAITLNYAMGMAIGVILITGLLIAGGTFVTDQRESAIRTELRVVGQQIAADVATADRLSQSTEGNSTVRLERTMPETVAGGTYNVRVVASKDAHLILTTENPAVRVRVDLVNQSDVQDTAINGGTLHINETASGDLEVVSGGASR
ncbi:hypothetical protein ACFR9U_09875 [Halorientalis brevis]|uniref:Flagellin n=1 Tax=Halorientalis brevis TaxID=1126241 RepID=A0ABD6CAN1_9EURY|nr:hypothetical protein [Halorientalis brevis]